jgi:hypothetical protein
MHHPSLKYFPRKYTNHAVIAFLATIFSCMFVFGGHRLPLIWLLFALIEFLGFYFALNGLSRNWNNIPVKAFISKLFAYSFILRSAWVIISYFFYSYQTGQPFMFEAADSLFYHHAGKTLAETGFSNIAQILPEVGLSDLGYPVYLSFIYFIFGDHVIIPRLINALLGAWTVILIYRLATRNFGEATGRLAGIMAMLMPNLIYYCGIHLKEALMVFLVVAFIERADQMLRVKNKLILLILLAFLGASLFFLRTVLLASILFALFSMLLFIRRPGSHILQRIIIGFWVLIIIWLTFSYRIQAEFEYLVENIDSQAQSMEWRSKREEGNRLAHYGSSVLFAPVMFVAPFPTFVNIETQQNQMLLSGGYFVKNVLAFFVLISLISFIRKRQLRKYILILSFLLAYLAILAQSAFALSERFHLPALPFLVILAAYGVTQLNEKNRRFYVPYLILLVLGVIAWNAFKLAGRGI